MSHPYPQLPNAHLFKKGCRQTPGMFPHITQAFICKGGTLKSLNTQHQPNHARIKIKFIYRPD